MEIHVEEQLRGEELLEQILAVYGSAETLRAAAIGGDDNEAKEMWATVQLLQNNPKRLRAIWKTTDVLQLDAAEIEQLTEKRLMLLEELQRQVRTPNVRGLARQIGRDKKNVSRDLKALASMGLVKFKRQGREAIPMLAGNVIRIDFRRPARRRAKPKILQPPAAKRIHA